MPSMRDITERVLSGKGIMRHTDENYYFGRPLYANAGLPDEYVPRVVKFLNSLKAEINQYYSNEADRLTNYEDLYYVSSQIHDSELREYDNPVVQAFIDKIRPEIEPLLAGEENEIRQRWQPHKLADEATNYIHCVVWHMLCKRPSRSDQLVCIKDACQDPLVAKADIFTLNHDTVVENYLSENQVDFCDGFGKPINEVRYWQPDSFDQASLKVELIKLHGSVNWFQFMPDHGNLFYRIGIPLTRDIDHTKGPDGKGQSTIDGRPMLLIGTFNKMLRYTIGMFTHLYCQFYRGLLQTSGLVICGYGFGDKSINARISEWIDYSAQHRAVVIDPDSFVLRQRARGEIAKHWCDWEQKGKLVVIPKGVEKAAWREIRESLSSTGSL